jgi:transposase-like protein
MEQGRKERRHFSGPEKVAILRRHLVEKVPVSTLCEDWHLQPTALYRWLKEFFDNGAAAFEGKAGSGRLREEQRRIQALEQKLRRKDEVLSELMEEHVALKKRLGEP